MMIQERTVVVGKQWCDRFFSTIVGGHGMGAGEPRRRSEKDTTLYYTYDV
jgi:hypothetical protein